MIAWIINFFLTPEFFGTLALLCGLGFAFFKVTKQEFYALLCEVAGIIMLVMTAYAWADNRGYARAEELYKEKLVTEQAANAAVLASIVAARDRAQTQLKAARAKVEGLKAQGAEAAQEIQRLQVVSAGKPAATKEQDCEDASKLVDSVIAKRLREPAHAGQ